jgi:hypothetical protein
MDVPDLLLAANRGAVPGHARHGTPLAIESSDISPTSDAVARIRPISIRSRPMTDALYLFRHPAPPDGFSPLPGAAPPAHVYEGRHPAVTSNSSAEIGGRVTATLRADGTAERSPTESAAGALHESFHVFQRLRHPSWQGNEGDLLLYPAEDARLLALRRQETEAFRRALATQDLESRCWSTWALRLRRERFAAMDSIFSDYEWRSELNEGLAQYIQERAAGHTTVAFPESGFAPAQVRHRSYAVGGAMALLLDRLDPDWKIKLEADDRQSLHRSVGSSGWAVPSHRGRGLSLRVAAIRARRSGMRPQSASSAPNAARRFDAAPGWRRGGGGGRRAALAPGLRSAQHRTGRRVCCTRFASSATTPGLSIVDEASADLESLTEGVGPHQGASRNRRRNRRRSRKDGVFRSGGGFSARFRARTRSVENQVIVGGALTMRQWS